MKIEVDLDSPVPPYEQVRGQLASYLDAGVLEPGDRLPSIRQLANDLGVATNTVQRAYRELEAQGLIRSRGRHGTIVLDRPADPEGAVAITPAMKRAADRLAREAAAAGGGLDDVVRAARAAFLGLPDTAIDTPKVNLS
jgi:DNA-binding transcriptional regulator YhcF (GntR family)